MINIEFIDKLNLKLYSIDSKTLIPVKNLLTSRESVSKWDYKTKKVKWVTEDIKQYKEKQNDIYVGSGYLPILEEFLTELDIPYSVKGKQDVQPIQILPKYWEMFDSHPKGQEYIEAQRNFGFSVQENTSGVISLGVGYGKGHLIVSLVDSFLQDETKSGNVAVISYSSKVCDELKLRLSQFNISSDRVKVLQPTGYCRTKAYQTDDELYDWDSNVSLFIADECHHFTASSWKDYIERCQPDYVYGFSGSADKEGGWELNLDSLKEKKLKSSSFELLAYCGPAIIHKELTTPIKLYWTSSKIADKQAYMKYLSDENNPKQLAPKFTIMDKKFPAIVKELVERCTDRNSICYIPELTSIETGVFLAKELNRLGVSTVYLSGATVESPAGEIEISLEELKDMARRGYIRILISNSVGIEGIDIPGLSSIISLTGRSYKNVVQAIGRSARADSVDCIFIFDENNGIYSKQAKVRYKTVTQRLNVISNKKVELHGIE